MFFYNAYKIGANPRGTNRKIPASQPTRRGRGMMVIEREMQGGTGIRKNDRGSINFFQPLWLD